MTETVDDLFSKGLERYRAGEEASSLIPLFEELCDRAPKNSSALTSLAWLYLLENKPNKAYKFAHKAVKLNPHDAQARVNLVVTMIESGRKGVRPHVDMALQLIIAADELRDEVKENIADGLSRKPDWPGLQKVKKWLFEAEE